MEGERCAASLYSLSQIASVKEVVTISCLPVKVALPVPLQGGRVGYPGKALHGLAGRIAAYTGHSYQQISWLPWPCREHQKIAWSTAVTLLGLALV